MCTATLIKRPVSQGFAAVSLPKAEVARLDAYAERRGLTRASALREIVREGLDRREAEASAARQASSPIASPFSARS